MFRFFTNKKWWLWSWLGSMIILGSLWVQVKIDVKINEWFGVFYDMIQKALATPNAVTIEEYFASLLSFITLAGVYVALYVVISFFTAHYLFRWRTAMVEWYHSVYDRARTIEGASQRVQEVFEADVLSVINDCDKLYRDDFDELPEEVQLIIANMMFNMGYIRLSKFKQMKRAVDTEDWNKAAGEMVNSKWYQQVTNRADRLVQRMRNI